jgi:monooxygenase
MTAEHFDLLIVGAGLSGIGAGVHLKTHCPDRSFVILEGRERLGGTWDLFRYPGIRSDSDMHTLGYNFKPWVASKAIADGPSILKYIKETAAEYKLDQSVRYQHKVTNAEWSSKEAVWRVEVLRGDTNAIMHFTCNVLYMCSGYYRFEKGHAPAFDGSAQFQGPIVHPQHWPEDLDYEGKRVVVIGSGATAITLIPSMTDKAAHVTMLQRSPTYIVSWPEKDIFANILNKVLPSKLAYAITRFKNIFIQQFFYRLARKRPMEANKRVINMVRKELGPGFDVGKHFTPSYSLWDQRVCLAPDGDFFQSLREKKASVVTDHIAHFTENGIALKSGEVLDADIIVTATGLNLITSGGVTFSVDGEPIDFSKTWSYKGMGSSGVPNLFGCFGYVNASWTLRADLISIYLCRVLNHMKETGARQCTPRLRDGDKEMVARPWVEGFTPGYIERVAHLFPKQGDREPWINPQNYKKDKRMFLKGPVDDGVMAFTNRGQGSSA